MQRPPCPPMTSPCHSISGQPLCLELQLSNTLKSLEAATLDNRIAPRESTRRVLCFTNHAIVACASPALPSGFSKSKGAGRRSPMVVLLMEQSTSLEREQTGCSCVSLPKGISCPKMRQISWLDALPGCTKLGPLGPFGGYDGPRDGAGGGTRLGVDWGQRAPHLTGTKRA